jgi:hypothetical protein
MSEDVSQMLLIGWSGLVFWVLGQLWFAQIVVYPLFALVGGVEYTDYHRFYASRIPWPVIVPGFASFLLPLPLAWFGPPLPGWLYGLNIGTGLVGLLLTVLLLIPRHEHLTARGKDRRAIAELVRYNWPRTLAVTLQAVLAATMLGLTSAA